MSACKQIRMMGRRSFPSYENIAPHINYVYGSSGGLLQAPPPPPPPPPHLLNLYRQLQLQQQQPPLLPLPSSRTRSQSLTPKKPKSKRSNLKKQQQQQKNMNNSISSSSGGGGGGGIIMDSTTRLGPDPNDLPKDVTKVLSSKTALIDGGDVGVIDMDNFSSSIFTLAPPPSSLPLPRFSSLKQKPRLGCKGGVDAGATDNLCRLLRLQ